MRISGTPWGTVPVLTVDGEEYGQTLAIARYTSHMTGTAARNVKEAAYLDDMADAAEDIFNRLPSFLFEEDETRKVRRLQNTTHLRGYMKYTIKEINFSTLRVTW